MNRIILIILIAVSCINIKAQITITNDYFPVAGDTLFTATDNLPSINIGTGGANQVWDFSNLQAPFTTQSVIKDADAGDFAAQFPSATILTDFDAGGEAYFRTSDDAYEFMGYAGTDPTGFLGMDLTVRFDPPTLERQAPLQYEDQYMNEATASIPFSADLLPSEVFDNFPITPDSIRIRFTTSRANEIDAWGTLSIPGDTYEVLREKRIAVQDIRLDIKIGFFPWQDITDLLAAVAGDFLGQDTTITYNYYSNEAKEVIASVNVSDDESTIESVTYKVIDIPTSTSTIRTLTSNADIFAYPNPAIDSARFEFSSLPKGQYTLRIYNILGIVIWEKEYEVMRDKTVVVDLGKFKKGTYLYSLQNDTGKTIATKRLLIIRP